MVLQMALGSVRLMIIQLLPRLIETMKIAAKALGYSA
jgi:hypothetical protein